MPRAPPRPETGSLAHRGPTGSNEPVTPEARSYRWVLLGAATAIISTSIGTLFSLGVFLTPVEQSMGWSRSSIGAIAPVNSLVMGLISPTAVPAAPAGV